MGTIFLRVICRALRDLENVNRIPRKKLMTK